MCEYNKLLKQYRDDRVVMFRCYDEEDEKLLGLFREVRDYWEAVMEHEFCVCLWSGLFVATVC